METKNLGTLYELKPMEWAPVAARLDQGFPQGPGGEGPNHHTTWLATINADGSPHVNALGALWVDGTFWFVTGENTRRGRNLARDPRCTMSVTVSEFDLAADGTAEQVTDPATVSAMAERWAAQGWPCRVDDSGTALTAEYSAPSAGRPPWHIYRMTLRKATALGTVEGEGGATQWTF